MAAPAHGTQGVAAQRSLPAVPSLVQPMDDEMLVVPQFCTHDDGVAATPADSDPGSAAHSGIKHECLSPGGTPVAECSVKAELDAADTQAQLDSEAPPQTVPQAQQHDARSGGKYIGHHMQRLQTTANHVLFYVVNASREASLAIVVSERAVIVRSAHV